MQSPLTDTMRRRGWLRLRRSAATAVRTVAPALLASLLAPAPAAAQQAPRPAEGFFDEPRPIQRAIDVALRTAGHGSDAEKSGLYPELGHMITGAGWISGGPGYRQWLFGDRLVIDTSGGVSWRLYKMARATAEVTNLARSRVALGTELRWQDAMQINYFGAGPDSPESARSQYRMKTFDSVGYARFRPARWAAIDVSAGWLREPLVIAPAGSFDRGFPDVRAVFPADPVFARAAQPSYVHGELSFTADTRDHRGHASRGGAYRAAWARFDERGTGVFAFDRYELESAHFIPLSRSRIVLALHGWLVASPADDAIPFYLLPSLGGANTLRAYADYRFHDRTLGLAAAESRVALFEHIDLAAFLEVGGVAPRLGALDLDRRSLGAGIRLHTGTSTLVRLDVAHGAEGWRLVLRTNDALRLARIARHTAPAPFAP